MMAATKCALNQSIIDNLAILWNFLYFLFKKKQKKFHNIDDLKRKLNFLDRNYWSKKN